MKGKYFLLLLCILIITLSGCDSAKGKMISYQAVEDFQALSESVREACAEHEGSIKPVICLASQDGTSEYMVYYGYNKNQGLYQSIEINAYFKEGTLRIEIENKDAMYDSNVIDELATYFTLEDNVENIEVFVDDEKVEDAEVLKCEKIFD